MPHDPNQPIPMCWRMFFGGAWIIISDRMAALVSCKMPRVPVRLTCLDVECESCGELCP